MADIKNKNELRRRIELFLDEFTSEEYKINEEFCKETMKMMREFIGHTDNCINVLIAKKEKKDRQIRFIQEQIPKWHLVADGDLPKEHDSMFAKFKGTDKWNNAMFEKISDDVIVAIKDENGRCVTTNAHTTDGKWKCDLLRAFSCYEVVAWMELPKFESEE